VFQDGCTPLPLASPERIVSLNKEPGGRALSISCDIELSAFRKKATFLPDRGCEEGG
jgi:hypothetical protein